MGARRLLADPERWVDSDMVRDEVLWWLARRALVTFVVALAVVVSVATR